MLTEANMAADDMREIIGMNNASVGVPNAREESGIALKQRRIEADTGTAHFHDNLKRAVRCAGRIVVDLIPKVYSSARVMRILGVDGKQELIPVNQDIQMPPTEEAPEGSIIKYDLTVGKYDVVVEAGPSFTTKREEAAEILTTAVRAAPELAPILLPQLVKMTDLPDGQKVTEMLATLMPPDARAIFDGTPPPQPDQEQGLPPEVMMEQAKAMADMELSRQKAEQDFQLEQQKAANKREIEQTQAIADIQVDRQKAEATMQIEREKAVLDAELAREKARLEIELDLLKKPGPVPEVPTEIV